MYHITAKIELHFVSVEFAACVIQEVIRCRGCGGAIKALDIRVGFVAQAVRIFGIFNRVRRVVQALKDKSLACQHGEVMQQF